VSRAYVLHKARTFTALAASGRRQDVDPLLEVGSVGPQADPKEQEREEVLAWAVSRAPDSLLSPLLDGLRTEELLHNNNTQTQAGH
jgi:hypothetical protein